MYKKDGFSAYIHCGEKVEGVKFFFDDVTQLSPRFKRKILDQERNMYNLFKKQISDLEKIGLLRPVNKVVATFCCLGVTNWPYHWFKEDGKLSVEEIAENIIDVFFEGILNTEKIPKSQRSVMKMGKRWEN